MSAREDFLALEQIRRDTISVPRAYIDIAGGDIASGVMLAQLLYWFGDAADGTKRTRIVKDGRDWIARKWDEWHKECRLTPDQARRCVEVLSRLGLVEKDIWRFDGSPTVHLSLNFEAIMASHKKIVGGLVAQMDLVKNPDPSGGNPSSIPGNPPEPLTETTSETTTEKKSARKARSVSVAQIPDPPPEIDSPGLRAYLPEFAEYRRKERKKPLTSDTMWRMLFERLKSAGKEHAVLALRYARANNWLSFHVDWLKGASWEQVASELGLSLRKEEARVDPAAEAEADHKQAMARARYAYDGAALKLCPGSDGWGISSRTWLFDGLDALQSPEDFEARLDHARALVARLRALGAFPLVSKRADPGLIFPACGGGPWRPELTERGFVLSGSEPNCPLVTGIRPCMCDGLPRCPVCNYSAHDAAFEMDHASCPGRIPDEEGEDTGTIHDPGDGSVPTYFPGPNETDASGDCPRCNGEPYFGLRHELCMDCVDELERLAREASDDDWDDEGTHVCGDRSEP